MQQIWPALIAIITNEAVAVGIGGAAGANARYWLGKLISAHPWGLHFPFGTLFVNITGSFFLGILSVLFVEKLNSPHKFWLLLLGTGFCGGFTTFSALSHETIRLFENGKWHFACINIGATILAGLAAILLAFLLTRGILTAQLEQNGRGSKPEDTTAAECADS